MRKRSVYPVFLKRQMKVSEREEGGKKKRADIVPSVSAVEGKREGKEKSG